MPPGDFSLDDLAQYREALKKAGVSQRDLNNAVLKSNVITKNGKKGFESLSQAFERLLSGPIKHVNTALGMTSQKSQANLNATAMYFDKMARSGKASFRQVEVAERMRNSAVWKNQMVTGNLMQKISGATNLKFQQLGTTLESKVGGALGFNMAGMARFAGVWGIVALIISQVESAVRDMGTAMKFTVGAGGGFGDVAGRTQKTVFDLRMAAARGAYSFEELTEQLGVAMDQGMLIGGTLKANFGAATAETVAQSRDMVIEAAHATMNVAKLGATLGYTAEEAVKTGATLRKYLGGSPSSVTAMMWSMGAQAMAFGLPAKQFIELNTIAAEKVRYLNTGFGTVNASVVGLGNAFARTGKELGKSSDFWAKSGPQFVEMAKSTLEAISRISPEEYLAYSQKPIGDFGEAITGAIEANPFQKLKVAMDKLIPIAEMSGSKAGVAGRLLYLMPQFKELGPELGLRITQMAVNNKLNLKELSKISDPGAQLDMMKDSGLEIEGMSKAIYLYGDIQKAMLNYVMNLFKAVTSILGLMVKAPMLSGGRAEGEKVYNELMAKETGEAVKGKGGSSFTATPSFGGG